MAKSEKRKLIEKYIKDNELPVTGLKYYGMINYYPDDVDIVESNSVVKRYDPIEDDEPFEVEGVERYKTPCWYGRIVYGDLTSTIQFIIKSYGKNPQTPYVYVRVGTKWCFCWLGNYGIFRNLIIDVLKNPFKPNPSIKIRPVE